MEQPPSSDPAPPGDLQFDRADFGEQQPVAAVDCTACEQPIAGAYYEINGQVVCEPCQARFLELRTGGSAVGRMSRAAVFGTVAAAAGAGIYYGISALTGYEFGLIAIVVGFMVGFAVNFGAHQRGGWFYQLLAVGLTYLSIVSTYIPPIAAELRTVTTEDFAAEAPAEDGSASGPAVPETAASSRPESLFAEEESEGLFVEEEAEEEPAAGGESTAEPAAAGPLGAPPADEDLEAAGIPAVFFWIVVVGFAFVAPFLAGFENILGILIIGFGLFQAWQLNRKKPFEISGPFQVAGAGG